MLGKRKIALSSVVLVASGGAAAGTVMAHGVAGDPRPLPISSADQQRLDAAPVAPTERMFRFKGAESPTAQAARRGLACSERGGQTTCYSSEAELERAALLRSSRVHARADAKSRTHGSARQHGGLRTRAAFHGGSPMSIWEHADFHGWRIDTNTSCQWFNLPGGYNDQASSVKTGNHTGLLALDTGGGSHRLQWSAYAEVPHLSAYYFLACAPEGTCVPISWNDQASSRQRRGC